ncbi:unnamed protein product [Amoebophrya sp. A120]|nr:unnamed protein product [Amoebophrya sp. A120]|eukprot:GSA120T00026237001.1
MLRRAPHVAHVFCDVEPRPALKLLSSEKQDLLLPGATGRGAWRWGRRSSRTALCIVPTPASTTTASRSVPRLTTTRFLASSKHDPGTAPSTRQPEDSKQNLQMTADERSAFYRQEAEERKGSSRIFRVEAAKNQRKVLPDVVLARLQLERLCQEGELALIQEDVREQYVTLEKIDLILDYEKKSDTGEQVEHINFITTKEEKHELLVGHAIKADMLLDFYRTIANGSSSSVVREKAAKCHRLIEELKRIK